MAGGRRRNGEDYPEHLGQFLEVVLGLGEEINRPRVQAKNNMEEVENCRLSDFPLLPKLTDRVDQKFASMLFCAHRSLALKVVMNGSSLSFSNTESPATPSRWTEIRQGSTTPWGTYTGPRSRAQHRRQYR